MSLHLCIKESGGKTIVVGVIAALRCNSWTQNSVLAFDLLSDLMDDVNVSRHCVPRDSGGGL